jgi:succinyl-CoA synthetase beta subunit
MNIRPRNCWRNFGAPIAAGHAAFTVDEAVAAAGKLPGPLYVVKAQIHAGGRGKGKFKELGPDAKGGVRLAKTLDEVEGHATDMLGNTLVTIQTGPAGKQVNRLYITDGATSPRNSTSRCWSTAHGPRRDGRLDRRRHGHRGRRARHPEKIHTITIDPATGFMPHHGRASPSRSSCRAIWPSRRQGREAAL